MLIIYLQAKFHIFNSSGSLVFSMKPKAKKK
jgi:hypothetical protein